MKKDIIFPTVEGISIAILKDEVDSSSPLWQVYLINTNNYDIANVTICTHGYGNNSEGIFQETSTLRYFIQSVAAQQYELIEPIDVGVFHLNNEYWVSYFVGDLMYDKRFVFVPDTIMESNFTTIPLMGNMGVLHQ